MAASDTVTVRDSAGVRIVESSAPAWLHGAGWTVDADAVLDLTTAGDGAAHEFYRVRDVIRLANANIAVTDGPGVRVFSELGTPIATLGQEGEGPGDFLGLSRLSILGPDSLVAFDFSQRRVTIYGPDGGLARVASIDIQPDPYSFGVLEDGFVLLEWQSWPTGADVVPGLKRLPGPIVVVPFLSQPFDTIGFIGGTERVFLRTDDGRLSINSFPLFGRDSHIAVYENSLVVGEADHLEYRILAADGTVERIVRGEYDLMLSPDLLAAERSAWVSYYGSGSIRRFEGLPVPDRRAAYSDLLIDPTGSVWLEEHRGWAIKEDSTTSRTWEVFDADGVWLGPVSLPARFTAFEIGPDYVLGVLKDELDVEHVQVLRLTR